MHLFSNLCFELSLNFTRPPLFFKYRFHSGLCVVFFTAVARTCPWKANAFAVFPSQFTSAPVGVSPFAS